MKVEDRQGGGEGLEPQTLNNSRIKDKGSFVK